MTDLRHRPTADLVAVFLAALVGVYLIVMVAFVAVLGIVDPDSRTLAAILKQLGTIVGSVVGALIGYVGGRAVSGSRRDDD